MKQKILFFGTGFLFVFLLRFPAEALSAAKEGMSLWLNTLVPTLLPFLILTGILLYTDSIEKIFSPFKILWKTLLGLSPSGAYAFFLGILCGYPMGAKIASELYTHHKINKQEAEYLLTFSNNASPAFLISYLTHTCLQNTVSPAIILSILLSSNFICMIVFRFILFKNKTCTLVSKNVLKKETSTTSSSGTIIDVSIMNGFETISKIGGYILIFSLLSACISHYWIFTPFSQYLILGILEITTGLHTISTAPISFSLKFIYAMGITAFGGICIMAQTRSVTNKELSFIPFFLSKCLNALITILLILVFTQIV